MFVCLRGTERGRSQVLDGPILVSVRVCSGSSMHGATHLPYDKEDESSAQHQGEHVAEGRKGERHGCASQPDDEMGRERERELAPCSLPLYWLLPTLPPSLWWRLLSASPSDES